MAYFGNVQSDKVFSKMEPRTTFLLLWFVVCAIVVLLMVKGGIFRATPVPQAPVVIEKEIRTPTIKVLVPKEAIKAGEKLREDQFVVQDRVVQGMEERVVTAFASIEGTYASAFIAPQAPLLKDYVTFTVPANALTAKIPDGFRAVTISVDAESGVEGWVRPGVRVDVVWLSTLRGKPAVTTIVEDAEILSAERSIEADPENSGKSIPSHVTLLVSIKDGQKIQLAKTTGSLSLSLRGTADRNANGNETITVERLLRSSETEGRSDATGWIKVGDKGYEITTEGKLQASDSAQNVLKQSVDLPPSPPPPPPAAKQPEQPQIVKRPYYRK